MKPLSLKMRAISLLSQREHSLIELRRKLLRIARQQRAAEAGRASDGGDDESPADQDEAGAVEIEVDALLAWLQVQDYLSEARFVESRVHARSQRFGSLRIKQELAQHGLVLSAENQAELKASEMERAKAIWQRKYGGAVPDDPSARARQARFLVARGFSPEVVRRLLRADFD